MSELKKKASVEKPWLQYYPEALRNFVPSDDTLTEFILKNNSYIDICENDAHIRALKQEIAKEEALIEQLQEEINNSESDIVTIDRIAREKHGMQLPYEDVYLIVESPADISTLNNNQ